MKPELPNGENQGSDLIGTDVWDCDNYPITPAMRRDMLASFGELYLKWEDKIKRQAVVTEEVLLARIDGDLEFVDFLNDWIAGYLSNRWIGRESLKPGVTVGELGLVEPVTQAQEQIQDWLIGMRLEKILDWCDPKGGQN